MQRADKRIDGLLDKLRGSFARLRQGAIDPELFDVTRGYEALSVKRCACGAWRRFTVLSSSVGEIEDDT